MRRHVTPDGALVVSNVNSTPYPETTGYAIPTMLQSGERSLALSMAKWLVRVQEPGGAFRGPDGRPYVFDTAQALRGLLAVRGLVPEAEMAATRAANWLLAQVDEVSGAWPLPETPAWAGIPEAVHLYAILPLQKSLAARGLLERNRRVIKRLRNYYANRIHVRTNTHFLGYVAAGLAELGLPKRARRVSRMAAIPTWPGTAQLSETMFALGDWESGARLLNQMAMAQSKNGGWTGSSAGYFENEEVTWAAKFYLDACRGMRRAWFERHSASIAGTISASDDRLLAILDTVAEAPSGRILDAGCGRGRYLHHLVARLPRAEFHGCDPTQSLLGDLPPSVQGRLGELTNLPYPDTYFDAVFSVEALEHCVFAEQALREMTRVTRRGGIVVIVDKDITHWGDLPTLPWEQWFSADLLAYSRSLLMGHGLFRIWTQRVS